MKCIGKSGLVIFFIANLIYASLAVAHDGWVEIAFSQITVKGSKGEVVSQGKLRQLASDTLAIDVKAPSAGNYSVEWQALFVDTHVTDGTLRFSVAAAAK